MSGNAGTSHVVARLAELVAAETPTGARASIRDALGLVDGWLSPELGPPTVETVGDVDHLFWPGGPAPRLLLLGHLDTVWPAGTSSRRPFRVDGDVATGPGVFDMKAGIVILVEALARARRRDDVSVLLTTDEETGSLSSRALIEREARRAAAVLVLEPSLGGAIKVARRGGSIYNLRFHGRGAHAGLEPEEGRNALVELARQVVDLPAVGDVGRGTIVSPTVARAGTVTNVIPDHAELQIDVRAWSLAELERVHDSMTALRPYDRDVRIDIDGGINRPPMEAGRADALVALARDVSVERGLRFDEPVAVGGASDGNFTAALGVPTLDGLGPDGGGAHADGEWVSLRSLLERIELVTGLIDRWEPAMRD